METTTYLDLPYIMPSQAQKHVTHNEALSILDAVIQLSVRDRDLTEPSGTEDDGERYIVAEGGTGAWLDWDGAIAVRIDGAWQRIVPHLGWIAWVEDEAKFICRRDTDWLDLGETLPTLQNLQMLGVGTTADSTNPFAAKLNNALWSARYAGEGGNGNLRYTMNKEEPSGVLSLLMQSGWSGRAEIGLVGNDDLTIKTSPDGTNWKEALRLDRTSGKASFPQTPAFAALGSLTGTNGAFVRFTGANSAAMQAIVGTVSQAGGVPTGALLESGTNANGTYVRYADGTQLCTGITNTQVTNTAVVSGWFYNGTPCTATFAAAFSAAPQIIFNANRSDGLGAVRLTACTVLGTTTTGIQGIRAVSHANTHEVNNSYVAIGRWY